MITGDITQIDLPNARRSGLLEAADVLKSVDGLAFVHFDEGDVVRHHLVQRIIRAYDEHKVRIAEQQMLLLSEAKAPESRSIEASGTEAPPNTNEKAPAGPREEKAVSAEAKG